MMASQESSRAAPGWDLASMSEMRDGQEGSSISNQPDVGPAGNPPNGDEIFLEAIQDIFRLFLVDDVQGVMNRLNQPVLTAPANNAPEPNMNQRRTRRSQPSFLNLDVSPLRLPS
ncbi:MAG: hypothetical protein Q9184_004800 [Pyrenodesmia sp. 2 TL-2023]